MKLFRTLFLVLIFFILPFSSFAKNDALNCDLVALCFEVLPKIHVTLTPEQMMEYAQEGAFETLENLDLKDEIEKEPVKNIIQTAPTYKALCNSLTQIYQNAPTLEKDLQILYETFLSESIQRIDPHAAYHTPSNLKDFLNQMNGDFKGLGIAYHALGENNHGPFHVNYIFPNSSTLERGLQVDDMIIKINDKVCSELTLFEFQKIIQAHSGSLSFRVQRGDQTLEISGILKKELAYPRVHSQFITSNGLVYIQILSFSETLHTELAREMSLLKKELYPSDIRGILLDLRGNGGGSLNAAIETADLFLDQGLVTFTKDRNGNIKELSADHPGELTSAPLIILINNGSASASEVFTGALQDHGRALGVGSLSYGKATVQQLLTLPRNTGTVRITYSFYYLPSGQTPQLNGILPDIEIEQPGLQEMVEKVRNQNPDVIFYEKDYKNALHADPVPRNFEPTYQFRELAKQRLTSVQMREEFSEFEKQDIQLTQAIDLLKILTGQSIELNHFGKAYYYSSPYPRLHITCDLWTPESAKENAFLTEFKFRNENQEIYKTYGFMVGRELTLSLEDTPLQKYVKKMRQGSFFLDITVYQKSKSSGEIRTYTHSTIVHF
ncbi:MAG: hypothetical protein HYY61_02710 [Deltaproteobacteria bacterium]|nr:hypothetical protein [Deltaproteobacteria bacterium]